MRLSPTPEQNPGSRGTRWSVYRIFGFTLSSDFPFANQLVPSEGDPDLTFTCVDHPPFPIDWRRTPPAYLSPYKAEDGESLVYLYRLDACDVMHFTRVADFYLWPDRILCHVLDLARDYLVEIYLLGTVLSFWLERRGIPALHASAISVNGRAIVFLSGNQGGKSSVAASLMQAGYGLLTDDILPVEGRDGTFLGHPGYPSMRMWPTEVQHFLGHCDNLDIVHPALSKYRVPVGTDAFGTFCTDVQPLVCMYLLERHDPEAWGTEIEIRPVSRLDALIEMVRHSFVARMVEEVGLQPQRLDFFARMVRRMPMRHLVYPSGLEYLPHAREAILEDLAGSWL